MRTYKLLIVTASIFMLSCEKEKDILDTLPSCPDGIVFTHFPIEMEHVVNFIPLGLYNPSAHVFPSDHHYFNIEHGFGNIPVYAPSDGMIFQVTENQLPPPLKREYAIEIYACREISIKYGHISRLDTNISDQLGEVVETESYTTGGITYNLNIFKPRIKVKAGEKIAELLDLPEVPGMDFGTIDHRKTLPFVNPDRWSGNGYLNTVSFLNYSTPEIRNPIFHMLQNDNGEGMLMRNTPPIEGQINYDVPGTAQGLWFKPGKPTHPEDPHLSLIRDNYFPDKNVISMGTSVPGIPSIAFGFYPTDSGNHNRGFNDITPDGKIYTFRGFTNIWGQEIDDYTFPQNHLILMQLINKETLRVEKQTISDGPPWAFKNNYVDFER